MLRDADKDGAGKKRQTCAADPRTRERGCGGEWVTRKATWEVSGKRVGKGFEARCSRARRMEESSEKREIDLNPGGHGIFAAQTSAAATNARLRTSPDEQHSVTTHAPRPQRTQPTAHRAPRAARAFLLSLRSAVASGGAAAAARDASRPRSLERPRCVREAEAASGTRTQAPQPCREDGASGCTLKSKLVEVLSFP
eukprot:3667666-Pleurochrysis_carterae.AAC.1